VILVGFFALGDAKFATSFRTTNLYAHHSASRCSRKSDLLAPGWRYGGYWLGSSTIYAAARRANFSACAVCSPEFAKVSLDVWMCGLSRAIGGSDGIDPVSSSYLNDTVR
jgi:hypothetical protein